MHQIQEEIGIPKVKIKSESDKHAVFEVSPLPPGYGMTIGNSFRRVLLSSVPGAAVSAIKIPGISHEYSVVKGVKHSVLDIMLRIKLLHIKKISKDLSIIKLTANKEGDIYAKDIKCPSDVEILNPDLYITSLNGKGSKLNIELMVEKGVGYKPAVLSSENQNEQGIIQVDAFFSPVKKVRYDVEATRVGQMTNLDKLTLEIETDGSITPHNALIFASNILKSYFSLFNQSNVAVEEEFVSDIKKIAKKEESKKKPIKEAYTPIEILGLSPRTLNALINGDIGSIEQLVKCTESKLTNLRGFGKKALTEVSDALSKRNLKLSVE
jgi:DNA-directed RNA polymerase subunit alpha